MTNIMDIAIIGLLVGVVGTGLGGFIVMLLGTPKDRFISFILSFSGGIMLTIVTFDLLPQAFEISGLYMGLAGLVFGGLLAMLAEKIMHVKGSCNSANKKQCRKIGWLIGLGVALHNFPEGLAIGSGFSVGQGFGLSIALVIAIHNIPEGISIAAPLKYGGMSGFMAFMYTILVGLPLGVGALIGAYLGNISHVFISICLGFAGGTMLVITCEDILPNSKSINDSNMSALGLILGFVLGILLTAH